MSDSEIQDYDGEIDYKEHLMQFLTRWCAACQNKEPMTRSDMVANEFAIEMQDFLGTGERLSNDIAEEKGQ